MKTKTIILITVVFFTLAGKAQENETLKPWSLSECIDYALNQNIQVRQSILTNLLNQENKEQAGAQNLPSVNASVRQNFSWSNSADAITGNSSFSGNSSSSYSLGSGFSPHAIASGSIRC